MRKLSLALVVLSLAALGPVASAAGVKPGTYVPVPLVVMVHAVDTYGNPCGICGDGQDGSATYVDGQDGVKANIDQYGNIIIDFQTTRAKIRGLRYAYSSTNPVPPGDGTNHYFSTIKLDGGGALQAMSPETTISVASCPLYDDDSGQPQYRHGFYRDCQSGFGPEGSKLNVTRTATGWDVEPEPGAQARVFSITTKGRVQVQDFGVLSLPFKMTLTPRQ
jgi:hypothetical protein